MWQVVPLADLLVDIHTEPAPLNDFDHMDTVRRRGRGVKNRGARPACLSHNAQSIVLIDMTGGRRKKGPTEQDRPMAIEQPMVYAPNVARYALFFVGTVGSKE